MILPLSIHAMGTRFEFVLTGATEPSLRAVGEAALEEVQRLHAALSVFQPESMLSFINRTACERAVRLDEDMWNLMNLCDRVHRDSEGAFDPTVGVVMQRLGLHPGEGADGPIGWADLVELDEEERTIRLRHRGVRIDLGAIAKGFALDCSAAVLREHGVEAALLHGGTSSVIAIGSPPDREGWRVSIRSAGESIEVDLADRALGVSAPRGRIAACEGGSVSHVIDPRSEHSAERVDTTAVVGSSAGVADAWATALVVLGGRPASMCEELESMIHGQDGWVCSRRTCLQEVS